MKVFLKLHEIVGQFTYREASFAKRKNIRALIIPEIFRSPLGSDIYRTMILPNCIDHRGFALFGGK